MGAATQESLRPRTGPHGPDNSLTWAALCIIALLGKSLDYSVEEALETEPVGFDEFVCCVLPLNVAGISFVKGAELAIPRCSRNNQATEEPLCGAEGRG